MAKKRTVPVSERALYARINRALQHKGQMLRRLREGTRAFAQLGRYYVLDLDRNLVIWDHTDIEAVARELNVMEPQESLETSP